MKAKYKHTNIVAQDWQRLAEFYERIFGCIPVPPERTNVGEWIERCTGVPGAEVRGVHLRLPGYGDDGPTLEIFQYNRAEKRPETAIDRPGYAHLAFEVAPLEILQDAKGLEKEGRFLTGLMTSKQPAPLEIAGPMIAACKNSKFLTGPETQ